MGIPMAAYHAAIENRSTLVRASQLLSVVSHLLATTLRAGLLYDCIFLNIFFGQSLHG